MKIELLWFDDCPNHEDTRGLLLDVLKQRNITTAVEDIDVTEPGLAERLRFPGSPTIRINDQDVEPGFEDPGDYAPRCRVYMTDAGLSGAPEREWVEMAIDAAIQAER